MDRLPCTPGKMRENHCNAAFRLAASRGGFQRRILAAEPRFAICLETLCSFTAHTRTRLYCRKWIKRLQSPTGWSSIIWSDTADLRRLRLLQLPASALGDDTQVHPITSGP